MVMSKRIIPRDSGFRSWFMWHVVCAAIPRFNTFKRSWFERNVRWGRVSRFDSRIKSGGRAYGLTKQGYVYLKFIGEDGVMTTRNEHTGDEIKSKKTNNNFRNNFDAIDWSVPLDGEIVKTTPTTSDDETPSED